MGKPLQRVSARPAAGTGGSTGIQSSEPYPDADVALRQELQPSSTPQLPTVITAQPPSQATHAMAQSNGVNNTPNRMKIQSAEILLPSHGIAEDLKFWTSDALGFRMDQVIPADDPQVIVLSGHGLRLRLDRNATTTPGTIRLLCHDPEEQVLMSPSGTRIELIDVNNDFSQPSTQHDFSVRRLKDNAPWVIGRAGMHYRDLIPSRLGGAIIASHIRIPDGGPVPDNVHYHTIGFQLIYCYNGWSRLVYEDQGPPFLLHAGDCVTQPPGIRHRVLESSENHQVIEIGVPAEHMTTIDHEMELPTKEIKRDREWSGQKFVRSQAKDADWKEHNIPGFEVRDTGIGKGSNGVASVKVIRSSRKEGSSAVATSHDSDILFTFVLTGNCTLQSQTHGAYSLTAGDAYTLPPGYKSSLRDSSDDLTLLEVSLPADFNVTVRSDA